jgi:pre-mRNA-splicing helicase BRR2
MEAMDPSENPHYEELIKKLGLSKQQLAAAAFFTNNKYPNIDLDFSVLDPDEIVAGSPAYLKIKLERDVDEDQMTESTPLEPDLTVHAPFYPAKKSESWWVVVGDEASKSLLAIKRVTIGRKLELKLEFVVPTPGEHELKCFLMCDSYVGVDQDPSFKVTAAEPMDEDEEEEEEEE